MKRYGRTSEGKDGGTRVLFIVNCYHDCPYAIDKTNSFSSSYYFRCELLNVEVNFDDNTIHFSTLEECPLSKIEEGDS